MGSHENSNQELDSKSTEPPVLQSYIIVWLDRDMNESDPHFQAALACLRQAVSEIKLFKEVDACMDFVTDIEQQRVSCITNDCIGRTAIECLHEIRHLDHIYIIGDQLPSQSNTWSVWAKLRGPYNNVRALYDDLSLVVKSHDQTCVSFSVFTPEDITNINQERLEPSFAYTEVFKRLLLEMEHDGRSRQPFIDYCREEFHQNPTTMKVIDEFEREYSSGRAIWWYTRECFIYPMLNQALRLLQPKIILLMGFFIVDLHRQIEELHRQQWKDMGEKSTVVYRGQRLSLSDTEKIKKAIGGLISFNSFLSTSTSRETPLLYAESAADAADFVGVLFIIEVDRERESAPFADIGNISFFGNEGEILFSMHTIFRIAGVSASRVHPRIIEVSLTLANRKDQHHSALRDFMGIYLETFVTSDSIPILLLELHQPDLAEKFLAAYTPQEQLSIWGSHSQFILSAAKMLKTDYSAAILHCEKGLELAQLENASPRELQLFHQMLGFIYFKICEYSQALSFYEKAFHSQQKSLPPDHPLLAKSCNNIGLVYSEMGDYPKALSFLEKAFHIEQEVLLPDHPQLASSCDTIGSVYFRMGDYQRALSFFEKGFDIKKKSLPPDHPDMANFCKSIGLVYSKMGDYPRAFSFLEKAFHIQQKSLPPDHPDMANCLNDIGSIYFSKGDYPGALSFFEKGFHIRQKSLPPDHPLLSKFCDNIGLVYSEMGEYSKALSFLEKAFHIRQKSLPPDHPVMALSYNNLATLYFRMGDYARALSFLEKALHIRQKSLPPDHPDLALSYNNVGSVYSHRGDLFKALAYFEKAVKVGMKSLPADHPRLRLFHKNLRGVRDRLRYT